MTIGRLILLSVEKWNKYLVTISCLLINLSNKHFISLNFPDLSVFSYRRLSKNDEISLISCQPPPQYDFSVTERTMETLMDLDIEEWSLVRNKMLRFHFNISEEIKAVVQSIRAEMRPELIPIAEEKANFGKEGLSDISGEKK